LPDEIEFWVDGEGRIHERLNYKKSKYEWIKEILYP
jgi:pyridoxine/pyridoxamine 5'-phosphate oxidase